MKVSTGRSILRKRKTNDPDNVLTVEDVEEILDDLEITVIDHTDIMFLLDVPKEQVPRLTGWKIYDEYTYELK